MKPADLPGRGYTFPDQPEQALKQGRRATAYLARERPPGLATPECFVVLHGSGAGRPLPEAGIDLLALRQLMGHASPETTAGYVHLSDEHLAAEYAAA